MHPPPGAAATRALRRFDELEAVCRNLLPCGEVMMWLSMSPDLAPRDRTRDLGASTEIESSRGIHGLFTGGSLTPMSPTSCAIHLGGRSSTRPDRPEPLCFGDDRPPLSILSVGYTSTDNGYPPLAPARQRKRRAIASDPQPGTPGCCGVRSEPCRNVAAAARVPQTLPDRRLQVPSERRTCRMVSHRNTVRSRQHTKEPPKGLPGARNSLRRIAKKPNTGVS